MRGARVHTSTVLPVARKIMYLYVPANRVNSIIEAKIGYVMTIEVTPEQLEHGKNI